MNWKNFSPYFFVLIPAAAGGFVQSITGFGAGIVMMMILPFFFSVSQASAISQGLCTLLSISIFVRYRKEVNWKVCIFPIIFYFPIFLITMRLTNGVNTDFFKPILGLFLIALSLYFILVAGKFSIKANPLAALICTGLSAVVDALFGIGGPPIVVYMLAATKEKKEYLGTIQAYFMCTGIYGTIVRIYSGRITVDMIPAFAIGIFALIFGMLMGGKVVDKINANMMKKIVYAFIGIAGLITFLTNFSSLMA